MVVFCKFYILLKKAFLHVLPDEGKENSKIKDDLAWLSEFIDLETDKTVLSPGQFFFFFLIP